MKKVLILRETIKIPSDVNLVDPKTAKVKAALKKDDRLSFVDGDPVVVKPEEIIEVGSLEELF